MNWSHCRAAAGDGAWSELSASSIFLTLGAAAGCTWQVPLCVFVLGEGIYLTGSSSTKERAGPSGVLIIALVGKQSKGK